MLFGHLQRFPPGMPTPDWLNSITWENLKGPIQGTRLFGTGLQ